jgi:signal transduction histidine kinase
MATPLSNASFSELCASAQTYVRANRVLLIEDNPSDAQMVRSALVDLRDKHLFGHARAKTVSLVLDWSDERVTMVEDDGCGFDVAAVMKNRKKEQQLGLLGMEERVALVGGNLAIESARDVGTSLYVRIPILSHAEGELAPCQS